jgi:hypothetical protein
MTAHFTFNDRAHFTWCCWRLLSGLPEGESVVHDDQLCDCPGMAVRAAEERRRYEAAKAAGWGIWRTEETWMATQRRVREIVAEAPPLSPDQRNRVAMLLRRLG